MKNLGGTWYSEHGSRLDLTIQRNGTIEGTYQPALGGAPGRFRLVGMVDSAAHNGSLSFGFVVSWNNEHINQHSTSVWSGQLQEIDGEEVLVATWLLTRETSPCDDWAATMVGSDMFYRTPVEAAATRPRGAIAHPM